MCTGAQYGRRSVNAPAFEHGSTRPMPRHPSAYEPNGRVWRKTPLSVNRGPPALAEPATSSAGRSSLRATSHAYPYVSLGQASRARSPTRGDRTHRGRGRGRGRESGRAAERQRDREMSKPDAEALASAWSKKLVVGVWLKKTRCGPSPSLLSLSPALPVPLSVSRSRCVHRAGGPKGRRTRSRESRRTTGKTLPPSLPPSLPVP